MIFQDKAILALLALIANSAAAAQFCVMDQSGNSGPCFPNLQPCQQLASQTHGACLSRETSTSSQSSVEDILRSYIADTGPGRQDLPLPPQGASEDDAKIADFFRQLKMNACETSVRAYSNNAQHWARIRSMAEQDAAARKKKSNSAGEADLKPEFSPERE